MFGDVGDSWKKTAGHGNQNKASTNNHLQQKSPPWAKPFEALWPGHCCFAGFSGWTRESGDLVVQWWCDDDIVEFKLKKLDINSMTNE